MSKAKRELRRKLAREQRAIERRLEAAVAPNGGGPVLGRANIAYELSERTKGTAHGGMGMVARLVGEVGLAAEVDASVRVLRQHRPYHESDHVLNIAYNALCGGARLDDIEARRTDAVFLDGLGAAALPDPTTAGDFCRRFDESDVVALQHIKGMLKIGGRAAVVLPDNVLFEAGAGGTIRRRLLAECDLHTILRLPTGLFYAQGVKANVAFFARKPAAADPWTKETWVYDLRTNKHFTLKTTPLRSDDLSDFVECYRPGDRAKRVETERFHRFTYDELTARDKANLDITWLRDESLDDASTLPAPGVLAAEIVEELEAALAQFSELAASLPIDASGEADHGVRS